MNLTAEEIGGLNDRNLLLQNSPAVFVSDDGHLPDIQLPPNNVSDWYGNNSLHHAFADDLINLESVHFILQSNPEYVSTTNQFGRLPLHYALDRTRVNIEGIKLLIQAYPEGVSIRDDKDQTPYDITLRWKHSNKLKMLLLDVDSTLDEQTFIRLKYGVLGIIYNMSGQLLSFFTTTSGGNSSLDDNNSSLVGVSGDDSQYRSRTGRTSFRSSSLSNIAENSVSNTGLVNGFTDMSSPGPAQFAGIARITSSRIFASTALTRVHSLSEYDEKEDEQVFVQDK
jgi:hypothetical protein